MGSSWQEPGGGEGVGRAPLQTSPSSMSRAGPPGQKRDQRIQFSGFQLKTLRTLREGNPEGKPWRRESLRENPEGGREGSPEGNP